MTFQPLSDDLDENLDRLVVESLQLGCVWGLMDEDGNWAMVSSVHNDEVGVIPVWSHRELAQPLCLGEWSIYQPTAIEMGEFLDEWLPGMHKDLILVGINWNTELEGDEMEPLDLLEEFEEELG